VKGTLQSRRSDVEPVGGKEAERIYTHVAREALRALVSIYRPPRGGKELMVVYGEKREHGEAEKKSERIKKRERFRPRLNAMKDETFKLHCMERGREKRKAKKDHRKEGRKHPLNGRAVTREKKLKTSAKKVGREGTRGKAKKKKKGEKSGYTRGWHEGKMRWVFCYSKRRVSLRW